MTFEEIEAIKRGAYETIARIDETLAQPRPAPGNEWEPGSYKSFDVARLDVRLDAVEAKFTKRIDELEARFRSFQAAVAELADEAGGALGQAEKRLREETQKEADALRGEIAMVRADMKASPPQRRKATSRAPWRDVDASLTN